MDERLPGGLLLNSDGLMPAEDQRLAAKVFISAFLEATLHSERGYIALFQDYRVGKKWLPTGSTDYVVRYDDANMVRLAEYDSIHPSISRTDMEGMESGASQQAKDRDGKKKGTVGMALHWEKPGALYALSLAASAERTGGVEGDRFVFSMSNLEWELSNGSFEAPLPPLPEIELSLTTQEGAVYELELKAFMEAPEPAYTSFLTVGKLEHKVKNNKYKNPTEAVAQTYFVPLALFELSKSNSKADIGAAVRLSPAAADISRIEFRFKSERGKVLLDDIGFMPGGSAYVNYRQ
jgi:hypothetical protein